MDNDSKVCNHNQFCSSSDECHFKTNVISEEKLMLKSHSSSSHSVYPTWVHYYLQYRNCQSCSQLNKCYDMFYLDSLAGDSVPGKEVTCRSHPVDNSCQTSNLHSLCDCQSKVDIMNRRYGSDADIPDICHRDGVQTMAIFNWHTYNVDCTQTNLMYLYPQVNCTLKGFYWAKSDSSSSYWDLSICSNLP